MSIPKAVALAALVAVSEARFGQEQIPVAAVQQLGDDGFGEAGVAATIAGSIPAALLAAASPCDKLTIADQIIDELGTEQPVVDAAIGLVAAETNFNPFAVDVPFVCADATLPVNAQLRGITPLVDPAVDGAAAANTASEESVAAPFNAEGLSQAEVMIEQGFTSFTAVNGAGENIVLAGQDGAAAGGAAGGGAAGGGDAAEDATGGDTAADQPAQDAPMQCGGTMPNNGTNTGDGGNNAGNTGGGANAGAGDLDFGVCQPTIARVGGLNGRPADEFTFIPQDPLVAEGQQEALNPNIITNRICDQLVNVCEATEDAVAACEDAQAEIEALGTRDQSTADTWNALLGFDGVDSTVETI